MKKDILTEILFLRKRQEALEKKLDCKFIWINTSKENYDADYEIDGIQTFISELKNKKLRELEKKNEELKKEKKRWRKKIEK